jgi:hypothetical protein
VVKPEQAQPAKLSDNLVTKLLAVGKLAGTVTDKNEVAFKALADTNMDLFVDMLGIDGLADTKPANQQTTRLSDAIAAVKKGGSGATAPDDKDFAWYEKNAPAALAKMEVNEPDKFTKLKEADEAKYQQ